MPVGQFARSISRSRFFFCPVMMIYLVRSRGLEIGADDYVIKPISPSELVARLKAVLRRAKASDPSFMFGENCVDRIARRCEHGKKVAKLSLRELQILEFRYRKP